jgi:hypothetical protein
MIHDLIRKLMKLNMTKEFTKPAVFGSAKFGEKIRLWQALCVLSRGLRRDIVEDLMPLMLASLQQVCNHAIRVHMEIFISSALICCKGVVLPVILEQLRGFNHSPQVMLVYYITFYTYILR